MSKDHCKAAILVRHTGQVCCTPLIPALERSIKQEETDLTLSLNLRIYGDRITHFWSEVEVRASDWLFYFSDLRLNPTICLWVFITHAIHHPISGAPTFYTDANKSGKAGYKLEKISKVSLSTYNSDQKSELYAILIVLLAFSEPINIVTDSQYTERFVIHLEIAELIPDK